MKKDKDVTIIIPLYKPDKDLLKKVYESIKNQDYDGEIEILTIEEGLGFGGTFNYGLKKSKYDILVSLHQDCVPSSNDWLKKLVEPLKNENVVASVSKVELPFVFWNKFDIIAKILSAKEQAVLTPLLDQKGCANKKSAIIESGMFDTKHFATAGEDFDMYIKFKKIGNIAYPDAKVIHYHKHTWKNRIKKELQLSNGFGSLVRLHGNKMPNWYVGILKAIPLIGLPVFLAGSNVKKLKFLLIPAIPIYLFINLIYSFSFWKGFLSGRQTQLI
jgi:GT2 family glycosyltransferase